MTDRPGPDVSGDMPLSIHQDGAEIYLSAGNTMLRLSPDAAEITGLKLIQAAMTARDWIHPTTTSRRSR